MLVTIDTKITLRENLQIISSFYTDVMLHRL
jgi:hypothetical protein